MHCTSLSKYLENEKRNTEKTALHIIHVIQLKRYLNIKSIENALTIVHSDVKLTPFEENQ